MAAWLRRRGHNITGPHPAGPPGPPPGPEFPDPASALPPEPRTFVGPEHQALVKALQVHLARPCLVVVTGPAGSGKSTICQKLLNTLESRRAFLRDEQGEPVHRRFWVDLEGCGPGAPFEERVARAVGCLSFGDAVARLSTGQPALIVLDNADDVWPGQTAVTELTGCVRRAARVVVTMRSPPSGDQTLWTGEVEVPRLDEATAGALLATLAPAARPELVARCGGLPLAITLVARTVGDDVRLPEPAADGLPFALAASAAALDDGMRRAWAALSLFPAGMGHDDVRQVLGPVDVEVVRLYQCGIARRAPTGLRIPGASRWPASVAQSEVEGLWQRYTARVGQVIDAGHGGEWLVAQQGSLAVLADRRPLPDGAFDVACAALLVDRPAHVVDTTEIALVALVQAAIGDGPVPPRLVEVEGILRERYRLTACQILLDLMLSASRRTGDRHGEAQALQAMGSLAHRASHYQQAEALFTEAQEIAGGVGDPLGHADVLFEQGKMALSQGRRGQAETRLSEAQGIYDAAGSASRRANTRLYRGQLAGEQGHTDLAATLLCEAQDIYDSIGNQAGRANARLYRGQLATKQGDLDGADRLLPEAQDIYDSIGDQLGRANARLYLGDLANRRGRSQLAESLVSEAQAIYDEIAHRLGQANARLYRGEVVATGGRFAEADELFDVAQGIYDEIGDRRGQANARYDRGQVARILGRDADAQALLADAQAIYDEIAPPATAERPGSVRRRPRRAQRVRQARRRHRRPANAPPPPPRRLRRSQRIRRAHLPRRPC